MRVYISADIEGVTGTTHWDDTSTGKPGYAEAREQMTAEVAAACDGFLAAGAEEAWVQDAHGGGRNILAAKLPEQTRLIRGWADTPLSMAQELDETFAAVAFVGYHSHAGSDANPLAHTWTGEVMRLTINGGLVSEFLWHAYAAATLNVPTVLVTGDEGLCEDVKAVNASIRTVGVKRGLGGSTNSIHPDVAVRRIREESEAALSGDLSACRVPLPAHFSIEIGYRSAPRALRGSYYPGATLKDARTVTFETDDFFDALRMLLFTV